MVGNLETKTGTAGETTFAYDENGRMLSQGDASRTGNFQYDASGRMVFDSSRSLSVTYDEYWFDAPIFY